MYSNYFHEFRNVYKVKTARMNEFQIKSTVNTHKERGKNKIKYIENPN